MGFCAGSAGFWMLETELKELEKQRPAEKAESPQTAAGLNFLLPAGSAGACRNWVMTQIFLSRRTGLNPQPRR